MNGRGRMEVRIATQAWEFEQIHSLNYRTFVEEIPQHPANPDGRLVDRYHSENRYLIAAVQLPDQERIVGMVAYRAQRPFSLDGKLARLDDYLPEGCSPCEIRLLAVIPDPAPKDHCAVVPLIFSGSVQLPSKLSCSPCVILTSAAGDSTAAVGA